MFFAPTKPAFRRFARAKRGSVAIEFGFVAIPFFLMVGGLAEVAMMGLAQTSLDAAVFETGRMIRTGRAQLDNMTEQQIKDSLCDSFFMSVNCDDNLFLDVERFDAFADITAESPIEEGELDTTGFTYNPGEPSDIVVVRVFYTLDLLTPGFATLLANTANGQRVLVSSMMFRNEPYETPAPVATP